MWKLIIKNISVRFGWHLRSSKTASKAWGVNARRDTLSTKERFDGWIRSSWVVGRDSCFVWWPNCQKIMGVLNVWYCTYILKSKYIVITDLAKDGSCRRDANTEYFHKRANGRRKHTLYYSIHCWFLGACNSFYKELFSHVEGNHMTLVMVWRDYLLMKWLIWTCPSVRMKLTKWPQIELLGPLMLK